MNQVSVSAAVQATLAHIMLAAGVAFAAEPTATVDLAPPNAVEDLDIHLTGRRHGDGQLRLLAQGRVEKDRRNRC